MTIKIIDEANEAFSIIQGFYLRYRSDECIDRQYHLQVDEDGDSVAKILDMAADELEKELTNDN